MIYEVQCIFALNGHIGIIMWHTCSSWTFWYGWRTKVIVPAYTSL